VKPAAALLAAGAATRFGKPKALLELDGTSFLRRLTDELAAVAAPVFVVIPPDAAAFAAALAGSTAEIVENPAPERGLGSLAGARRARRAHTRAAAAARRARRSAARRARPLRPPRRRRREADRLGGERLRRRRDRSAGRPSRAALGELEQLAGNRGARDLLERERAHLALVDFPGGRYDVDTPEDSRA
jgi:molybdenum cofactor cytidylyltransferase